MFAGRYEIRELLGCGTYGEVYAAFDGGPLRRMVALKVIRPAWASAAGAHTSAQFLKEARLAASLSHPRIATVHEAGESNGRVYMTQELVLGSDLSKVLKDQGPLRVPQALVIALQVCDALVYAHGKGIVHRDIKPGNILADECGNVKITDFGLALNQQASEGDEATLPGPAGLLAGTPGYMAPEQILGDSVDARADIFAVGCLVHRLLTGRHPFESESTSGVIQKTLHELPSLPSQFRRDVPPALDPIVTRACSKDPNTRYEAAVALGRDLLACLGGLDFGLQQRIVRECGLGWAEDAQASQSPAKRRLPIFAAAAVVLAGAMLLVAAPSLRWRAEDVLGISPVPAVRQVAVLPFDVVGADAEIRAFADGLTGAVAAKLGQLVIQHPIQVVPSREIHDENVTSTEQARANFGVNLVISGMLVRMGNRVRVQLELIDAIRKRQVAADTIDAAMTDPFALEDQVVSVVVRMLQIQFQSQEQRALAEHGTAHPQAYDYYLQGQGYLQEYQKPESVESAIVEFGRALEQDGQYALAEAGLGGAYWYKYKLMHDRSLVEKAREACGRAVELRPDVAAGHSCLGLVYEGTGEYEKSVAELRQALKLDPSDDDSYRELASAYAALGQLQEAEKTYQKAIALKAQYWAGYNELGKFYYDHARYKEAVDMFQQAIELAPDNARVYSNLGGTYLVMGRYADAIPAFERSVNLQPTAAAYSNLATAYFHMSRFTDGAETFRKAARLDPVDYPSWGNLADCEYLAPGQQDQAPEHYRKAIALAEAQLRVNPRDAEVAGDLADYYSMLKEREDALRYLKEALALGPYQADLKFQAAEVYNQLGDTDEAIRWLEKAVRAGYSQAMIRDAPMLDNLRSDPRFQRLLAAK